MWVPAYRVTTEDMERRMEKGDGAEWRKEGSRCEIIRREEWKRKKGIKLSIDSGIRSKRMEVGDGSEWKKEGGKRRYGGRSARE